MHKGIGLSLFALLPFTSVLAADQPKELEFQTWMQNSELTLEDLAHSFFFHRSADSQIPKGIVSEEGARRLEPELAAHRRDMNDRRKLAAKLHQACSDLRNAASAKEFAAVLVEMEEKELSENRQAARLILSRLDTADRNSLETFLDTDYRPRVARSRLDYEAKFTPEPFPSAETARITRRVCDAVADSGAAAPH